MTEYGEGTLKKSSGTSYYRARYYDQSSGRFLSEDPARSSSNFYPYVRNNPGNGTDPRGLWDTYTHHALIWQRLPHLRRKQL